MKRILKSTLLLLLLISTISSCNRDGDNEPDQQINIKIASISPDIGPKETVVTITGENFGTDTDLVSVYFNGKEAEVLTLNDTEITAKVPPLAYTGLVSITIGDDTEVGPEFTYTISVVESSIVAGSGAQGSTNGTGTAASFYSPVSLAIDSQDNIFVVDNGNHKIRKITPDGVVTTFAGSTQGFADGTGTSAKFNNPFGITIDSNDNLYIADSANSRIRKITSAGVVTTVAGGTAGFADGVGSNAQFQAPAGIVVTQDNILYVADQKNNRIRKIMPNGVVSTFSGSSQGYQDGTRETARYYWPISLTIDSQNNLYVSDTFNNKIRKISSNGTVSTIAGSSAGFANGTGSVAKFNLPLGIAVDSNNTLYVADYNNHKIRGIDTDTLVNTVAGSSRGYQEGSGATAKFNYPYGVAIDSHGNIFVADTGNNRIRKITQE